MPKHTPLQSIRAGQRHHAALVERTLPSYGEMQEWRREALVEEFLAGASVNSEAKVSFAGFAKKHRVGEQKLRQTMKKLTGAGLRKHNPKSNNLPKPKESSKYGEERPKHKEKRAATAGAPAGGSKIESFDDCKV